MIPTIKIHPTRIELLQAIHADLDDSLPRQVYADWLEEQGDSNEASIVRRIDKDRSFAYRRKGAFDPFWLIELTGVKTWEPSLLLSSHLFQWWVIDCTAALLDTNGISESYFWDAIRIARSISTGQDYDHRELQLLQRRLTRTFYSNLANNTELGWSANLLSSTLSGLYAHDPTRLENAMSCAVTAEGRTGLFNRQYLRAVEYAHDLIPHPWFPACEGE